MLFYKLQNTLLLLGVPTLSLTLIYNLMSAQQHYYSLALVRGLAALKH